jgi:hypothetical protein
MPNQSQMNLSSVRNLYQRLWQISKEAFAGEEFDIAYHALTAALYCGRILNDVEILREVENVARDNLAWIDAHRPDYDHSTQSASTRNHASVYQTLAQQAKARVTIIQNATKLFSRPHNRGNPTSSQE